jgi:Zn-dependent protease
MNERDPIEPQPPVEGDYLPPATQPQPQPQRARKRAGGLGAVATALAVLAAKIKAVLALLLQFKFVLLGIKLFASSWTFLLSLWIYVMLFGWRLGIVIVFVLLAHELGHYYAYRAYGLAVRLPVFVPLFGAYTAGGMAPELEHDAYIALAGPATGLGLAAVCLAIANVTGDSFWYACADVSAFLNLLNMMPVLPFDGGRAIGAVWPPLWIGGIALFIAAAIFMHIPMFFILILALMGLPAMIPALRGIPDPRAATMSSAARARVGVLYVATALALIVVLGQSHAQMPQGSGLL